MNIKNLIEIIKQENIVSIVNHYLPLSKKGNNYLAICPFHQDSEPSLCVNENKKYFNCFVCGAKGDSIEFVKLYTKKNFKESLIEIAEIINLDNETIKEFKNQCINSENEILFKINKSFIEYCQLFLYNEQNKFALDYLANRGINDEIIKYFKIGYNQSTNLKDLYEILTNEGDKFINLDKNEIFTRQEVIDANLAIISQNGDILDTFRNRIIFPVFNKHNQIIGFSGRDLSNKSEIKYLNSKFEKSKTLFNIQNVINKNFESLYIVEGFMDAIALYNCGYDNVVALMGVEVSNDQLNVLKDLNIRNIILALDNDNAGYASKIKISKILSENNFDVFVCNKFQDDVYKDFAEVFENEGTKKCIQLLNEHKHISLFLLDNIIKNKLNNSSDEFIKLNKSLEIIQNYGNWMYLNDYLLILKNNYSFINEEILKQKLFQLFK